MLKTILTSGAFVLALAASAQSALAQSEPASVHVSYADLNLATDDGAARMLARLQVASSRVCEGHRQGMKGVDADAHFQACRRTVLSQSIQQIGAPRVAALYAGRGTTQVAENSGSH
jgi:UrcA family protein